MPPSGFSQKAINGLLIFVQSCYEDLLKEIKEGKDKKSIYCWLTKSTWWHFVFSP